MPRHYAPTNETHPCPACGTRVCDDCDARRSQANRFAQHPQRCPNSHCQSLNGRMEPSRHRANRAGDHESSCQSCIADGLALRYPLDTPAAPVQSP
jgi:hypothetical protein